MFAKIMPKYPKLAFFLNLRQTKTPLHKYKAQKMFYFPENYLPTVTFNEYPHVVH